jgi:hypothetical protein
VLVCVCVCVCVLASRRIFSAVAHASLFFDNTVVCAARSSYGDRESDVNWRKVLLQQRSFLLSRTCPEHA